MAIRFDHYRRAQVHTINDAEKGSLGAGGKQKPRREWRGEVIVTATSCSVAG